MSQDIENNEKDENKNKKPYLWLFLILFTVGIAGAGWYAQKHGAAAAEGHGEQAGTPQATPVAMATVEMEAVQLWKQFSGQLSAVNAAQIRPQVSGTITEVKFEDGQDVKQGDVLFVIDPRPYEASLKQAEAELTAATNGKDLAWMDLKRAKDLIKSNAISQRILDERRNEFLVKEASVKVVEAAVEQAKIDVEYSQVQAPFDGKVSQVEVTKGNLVQAGPNAPILTTLVSNDEIYADFEVDEQTYISFVRGNTGGDKKIPVRMKLTADDNVYEGHIHSFDNRIDPDSGTIRARALFENKDGGLLPGMFASVSMGSAEKQDRILISDRAIGTNQDRKFVYVVGDDNMTAYREVVLGETLRGRTEIVEGLKSGERIVSDGIIRIRPGMPVTAQEPKQAAE